MGNGGTTRTHKQNELLLWWPDAHTSLEISNPITGIPCTKDHAAGGRPGSSDQFSLLSTFVCNTTGKLAGTFRGDSDRLRPPGLPEKEM